MLRQFWESPEGKAKSEVMTKIRSKVGKDVSFCSEQDSKLTPTRTRQTVSANDDFHTPISGQVKVCHKISGPLMHITVYHSVSMRASMSFHRIGGYIMSVVALYADTSIEFHL